MKFSSKDRNVNLELPVKIECNGKIYWIKASTKTGGIYMNIESPNVVLPKPNNLREQVSIQ